MPRLRLVLWIIPVVIAPVGASAAGRDSREKAAKRACLNGDASKGVQILTDLYIDTKDPTWIFNQGRCYEQSNRCEEAIGRFREYVRKVTGDSAADKSSRAAAEKHIADCETLLGRANPPQPAPAPQPAMPPPYAGQPYGVQPYPGQPFPPQPYAPYAAPPPAGYVPVAQPAPYVAAQPQANPTNGSGLRIAGITTMAVGGAALIAGVAFNLKANGMVSDLQNHYSESDYSSSKDTKTASQVFYGVGAVGLVGGAVLYILGVRAGSRVVVAPQAAADGLGLSAWGAF